MPAATDRDYARPARRTQQERRADTERKVLDATARLVARGGSVLVTLGEVGREAGYSRGIVNHHFGTKEALLASLARAAQRRVAPPDERAHGVERLLALVETYIDQVSSGEPYARAFLLLWAESVGASPELRAVFAERDRQFSDEIERDLLAGRHDGTVRDDLDDSGTAAALIGQLRGLGLQTIIGGDPYDRARAKDAVLAGLLRTIRPDRPPKQGKAPPTA